LTPVLADHFTFLRREIGSEFSLQNVLRARTYFMSEFGLGRTRTPSRIWYNIDVFHRSQIDNQIYFFESLEQDLSHVPILKDEVIMERQAAASARSRLEALKKELATLEGEMKTLQDAMDTLIRMQERYSRPTLLLLSHYVIPAFSIEHLFPTNN
jgi:hypothetical protein